MLGLAESHRAPQLCYLRLPAWGLPISKADAASGGEGSRMHPFICVSAVPVSEQQYEPRAPFRANHHRDVDGALGHPTCP